MACELNDDLEGHHIEITQGLPPYHLSGNSISTNVVGAICLAGHTPEGRHISFHKCHLRKLAE
jgi:hypothetical protein